MSDADLREEIARLEAEIEERAEAIERCRKIILLAKVVAVGGAILVVLLLLGLVEVDPAVMIGAIAAVIGAGVALGSTTTSSNQLSAELEDAEARRADLIGTLDLRVASDGVDRRRLH